MHKGARKQGEEATFSAFGAALRLPYCAARTGRDVELCAFLVLCLVWRALFTRGGTRK